MSGKADIERLRTGAIELVQPSGLVVGSIHAGGDGGRPEVKLEQEDGGHVVTLGFAANGKGPYLEMLSGLSTREDPETRIEIGAFRHDQHGLRVTGGKGDAYPPITLSWITGRASTNANRYLCRIPDAVRHTQFVREMGAELPSYMGKYPPCYEYAAQALAMPSCRASMEFVSPCKRRFTTENGREFYIGSPGAEREVMRFLGALEEGEVYYLPRAFVEYRKAQAKQADKAD